MTAWAITEGGVIDDTLIRATRRSAIVAFVETDPKLIGPVSPHLTDANIDDLWQSVCGMYPGLTLDVIEVALEPVGAVASSQPEKVVVEGGAEIPPGRWVIEQIELGGSFLRSKIGLRRHGDVVVTAERMTDADLAEALKPLQARP